MDAKRVWIDVGAYRGDESLGPALADRSLLVYAFEPLPGRCRELRAKAPPNYIVLPHAISERDGAAPFLVNSFDASSSLLSMDETARQAWIDGDLLKEENEIFVPTTRLDSFMARHGIGEVEYLKVDAQGADFQVLRSAGDRLRDFQKIKLEVTITPQQLYIGAADKLTITLYMTDQGFSLVTAQRQSHDQEENLTFVRNDLLC